MSAEQQLSFVEHTKSKLKSLREEVNKLKYSDFPEKNVMESLLKLEDKLDNHLKRLDSLPPDVPNSIQDAETWAKTCQYENLYINRVLPILGFILRSTNVRNAFELYDPILRICQGFFGKEIRLVFSSEWEFSPLTYSFVVPELSKFVFIGMPVSESENGLIVPLVGHEIAHSVWRDTKQDRKLEENIKSCVVEEIKKNASSFKSLFTGFALDSFENDVFFVQNISHWSLLQNSKI